MISPTGTRLLNEETLLLEWPAVISNDLQETMRVYQSTIEFHLEPYIIECYNSYSSLAICFDSEKISAQHLKNLIANLTFDEIKIPEYKTWQLPVCYDPQFAPDLESFAKGKNLSIQEIIKLHTQPVYKVHFYGFLPGFMYLGGLLDALSMGRKSTPDRQIKAGAVAIGGNQTGIYPVDSPGGWHVIGYCPLHFFNPKEEPPCFIRSGDLIKFFSINQKGLKDIVKQIESGDYTIKGV